jgi:hypothetical protein
MVLLFAGGAAAQLSGIDAPKSAGAGLSDSAQGKIEGSGPINEGTRGSVTKPAEGGVRGSNVPDGAAAPFRGSGSSKEPIALCERLAGSEREICVQQARQNRERSLAPEVSSTPGRTPPSR